MSLHRVPIGSSSSEGSKPGIAVSPAVLRIAAAVTGTPSLVAAPGSYCLIFPGLPAAGKARPPPQAP
ncbi:hypothetical protein R1flu_011851 [Riccia fluitans]|uniref:Uncharacterized protein n=1 Tax=Riccia fluitans TaxID=41844 RepID=A0ABD1Z8Y2_9MARC